MLSKSSSVGSGMAALANKPPTLARSSVSVNSLQDLATSYQAISMMGSPLFEAATCIVNVKSPSPSPSPLLLTLTTPNPAAAARRGATSTTTRTIDLQRIADFPDDILNAGACLATPPEPDVCGREGREDKEDNEKQGRNDSAAPSRRRRSTTNCERDHEEDLEEDDQQQK